MVWEPVARQQGGGAPNQTTLNWVEAGTGQGWAAVKAWANYTREGEDGQSRNSINKFDTRAKARFMF